MAHYIAAILFLNLCYLSARQKETRTRNHLREEEKKLAIVVVVVVVDVVGSTRARAQTMRC